MRKTSWTLVLGACLSLFGPNSLAQAADLTCQDTTAIQWWIPGTFEDARKAAEQQKRLLMIKGIAFGIDALGAKNATKGCW